MVGLWVYIYPGDLLLKVLLGEVPCSMFARGGDMGWPKYGGRMLHDGGKGDKVGEIVSVSMHNLGSIASITAHKIVYFTRFDTIFSALPGRLLPLYPNPASIPKLHQQIHSRSIFCTKKTSRNADTIQ